VKNRVPDVLLRGRGDEPILDAGTGSLLGAGAEPQSSGVRSRLEHGATAIQQDVLDPPCRELEEFVQAYDVDRLAAQLREDHLLLGAFFEPAFRPVPLEYPAQLRRHVFEHEGHMFIAGFYGLAKEFDHSQGLRSRGHRGHHHAPQAGFKRRLRADEPRLRGDIRDPGQLPFPQHFRRHAAIR